MDANLFAVLPDDCPFEPPAGAPDNTGAAVPPPLNRLFFLLLLTLRLPLLLTLRLPLRLLLLRLLPLRDPPPTFDSADACALVSAREAIAELRPLPPSAPGVSVGLVKDDTIIYYYVIILFEKDLNK